MLQQFNLVAEVEVKGETTEIKQISMSGLPPRVALNYLIEAIIVSEVQARMEKAPEAIPPGKVKKNKEV